MSSPIILVVGGCGFVGFHVVNALLRENLGSAVHVVSRRPDRNRVECVHYHSADISSFTAVNNLFNEVHPSLIIHAASPASTGAESNSRTFTKINVQGTKNLLDCAVESQSTTAFIYTSSASIMKESSADFIDESGRTKVDARGDYYARSKAIADRLVLDYNGRGGLRTACLRLTGTYGEHDTQNIPEILARLATGQHKYQFGDGQNLWDWVSASNATMAHILVAKSFLRNYPDDHDDTNNKIDGEAFFITDGRPVPFWEYHRRVWAAAGVDLSPDQVIIMPSWFILGIAGAVELLFWVFTLGLKQPRIMRRDIMRYAVEPRTYSIKKARDRLGYEPADDMEEQIRKGVQWEQQKGDNGQE